MAGVLDGIRVIEWALMIMGPRAASLLGDLGADVIKIEDREAGDPCRGVRKMQGGIPVRHPSGRNYLFEVGNRSKRGITLDLKKKPGREVLYRLVEKADVFLTNYRTDVAERLGTDYETLHRLNPRLVYTRASGYGHLGPDAHNPGNDYTGIARSGIMTLGSGPNGPFYAPRGLGDDVGAIVTAYGTLAALVARERTGRGQLVDTSQLGALACLQGLSLGVALLTGQTFRALPRSKVVSPTSNEYQAADGKWLALGMFGRADKYWPDLCRAMEIEELRDDPRFKTAELREQHNEELIAIFDRVFATKPREAWLQVLKEVDVVAAPVNTQLDLVTDPQMVENKYIIDCDHPVLGKVKMAGLPVQFSETPCQVGSVAPEHGQHTEEVLLELGYDWKEIEELGNQEVI